MKLPALSVLLALSFLGACSSGGGSRSTEFTIPDREAVPPGSADTAVASGFLLGGDVHWIVGVGEKAEGRQDLNADGDTDDVVLHVLDSERELLTNLGIAAAGLPLAPAPSARPATDVVPPPASRVYRQWCLLYAGEAAQGADLNGDGDLVDNVLFVFDTATRTLTNLELATTGFGDQGLWFHEDQMLFSVDESAQDSDLDGSGSFDTTVGFRYDLARNRLFQLTSGGPYSGAEVFDGQIAFGVQETNSTGDLDADGDLTSVVFHVFDFGPSRLLSSGTAISGRAPVRVADRWLFARLEQQDDWNGDGDVVDSVLHVFDPVTGVTTNLGVAEGLRPFRAINGETVTVGVSEFTQGEDLNGDGDLFDTVAHHYQPTTNDLTSTGLAPRDASGVIPLPDSTALLVSELDQSADLDGNGVEQGKVLHELDLVTVLATNLGWEGDGAVRIDRWLTFVRSEAAAGLDWNGDGDTLDPILFSWDPVAQVLANTGWPATIAFESQGTRVSFVSWEQTVDFTGDGETDDPLSVLYDLASNTSTVLPFTAGTVFFAADGKLIGQVSEVATSTDWNGDGDLEDAVLQIYGFGSSGGGTGR